MSPFGKLRVPSIVEGLRAPSRFDKLKAPSRSRGLSSRRFERVAVNALHL